MAKLSVRAIRAETGLSQAEFAAAYGIPYRTLQGWESGRREPDAAVRTYLRVIQLFPVPIEAYVGLAQEAGLLEGGDD